MAVSVVATEPVSTDRAGVAAVVLAAGSGSRFGATKQLAEIAGRPLVAHAVETARAADVDEVVVVVGHDADRVTAALPSEPTIRAVTNQRHAEGQSTSLRCGLDALSDNARAAVVLLADQPGIAVAAVRAVVAAWSAGATVARARYVDGPGHPVVFDRTTWPRLREMTGDQGARDLLGDLPVMDVPVAGAAPPDVDRPDDLDLVR